MQAHITLLTAAKEWKILFPIAETVKIWLESWKCPDNSLSSVLTCFKNVKQQGCTVTRKGFPLSKDQVFINDYRLISPIFWRSAAQSLGHLLYYCDSVEMGSSHRCLHLGLNQLPKRYKDYIFSRILFSSSLYSTIISYCCWSSLPALQCLLPKYLTP